MIQFRRCYIGNWRFAFTQQAAGAADDDTAQKFVMQFRETLASFAANHHLSAIGPQSERSVSTAVMAPLTVTT
jgi:hypothetical protein